VTYAFAGFQAPLPKETQNKSSTIPVKFMLANFQGTSLYPNVTGIRVLVSGPATATASCPYNATISAYQCQLKLPGQPGTYTLTVQQQLATDWVTLVNTQAVTGKTNANGGTITLK
jgi:hypothetical protein